MSAIPLAQAACKGVQESSSCWFISEPWLIRILTTAKLLSKTAWCNAVMPEIQEKIHDRIKNLIPDPAKKPWRRGMIYSPAELILLMSMSIEARLSMFITAIPSCSLISFSKMTSSGNRTRRFPGLLRAKTLALRLMITLAYRSLKAASVDDYPSRKSVDTTINCTGRATTTRSDTAEF